MQTIQSRRRFLAGLTAGAAAGLLGVPQSLHAESPLETTRVRLAKIPGICVAPQYVAEELLRAEGFTEVAYVATGPGEPSATAVAEGEIDFTLNFVTPLIVALDTGARITLLGGVHPGCFELFVKRGIDSVVDLKGRNVGVQSLGSGPHLFLASIAAYVGLDPARDINWVVDPAVKPKELFARGDVDAFLGFPPEPQELRRSKVGHVIVNSAVDRPWSQYFCCMLSGNTDFVAAHPVATKRVLRAILKAADLCTASPAMVAERLVAGGFAGRYDDAFASISEVPYQKWRDYDSTDAIRFYTLRLHEAGLIGSTPSKIIGEGTDWRFLNELKREMKT
jgi:NitT/TauT family transport system substrate-binding protein